MNSTMIVQKISETKSTILRKTHGEIVVSKIDNLQEFVELVISKIIKGAILISDNSKRRRITEREIEIAYEIYR